MGSCCYQERKSLKKSQDKSVEGGAQENEEDTLSQELIKFCGDPLPFLRETADADDDTVQHRAGLDARLYLRMVTNAKFICIRREYTLICINRYIHIYIYAAWATLPWHSVMLLLLLHVVLYGLVFLICAFFATRQFRRMRNPVFAARTGYFGSVSEVDACSRLSWCFPVSC